jgi:hypothetical protein
MRPYPISYWRLSRQLNVFSPLRRLFDLHPFALFLVCCSLSPGVMWVNDILLVHGRFIPLEDQWYSAQADVFLAAAVAIMAGALRWKNEKPRMFPAFVRSRFLHWAIIGFAVAVGAWHVWQERSSIPTWERRLGPNSLYHNLVLYPLLGYLLILLFIALTSTLFVGYGLRFFRFATLVAALFCVAIWYISGTYDGEHQYTPSGVHKSYIANPPDPWCGGLLTRPLCGPPER